MAKGKNFEREISVLFSLWLTNSKYDDHVWHTGSSGARGTVRKKNSKSASNEIIGDLAAAHDDCKFFFDFFNVELKTGYPKSKRKAKDGSIRLHNWSITDLLDGSEERCTLLKFWDQARNDALKSDREPLLVFRRNLKKPCIVMRSDIFRTIRKNVPLRVMNVILVYARFEASIAVMNLQDFFKLTRRSMNSHLIMKIAEEING